MNIPENVAEIMGRLNGAGFEAWAVGGCVRDSLMGRRPKDWDVCTSAKPEQVKAVLAEKRIIDTGIKHGTVTVLADTEACEVTTFRIDGDYSNNRRPDSVEYTDSLTADLSRRDFTVNAMAWCPERGLADPFGGRADIEKKVLRTVGEPEQRFREDALRILRGLRFAVDTGFEVEYGTASAMLSLRGLLDNISAERKRQELTAALIRGKVSGPFARFREVVAQVVPELRPTFDFEQRTPHHCYDVYTHILAATDSYCGRDTAIKTALLLHDAAKPVCRRNYGGMDHFKGHPAAGARLASGVLRRLKFDSLSSQRIMELIRFHDVRLVGGMPQMLKLMGLLGPVTADVFEVMTADVLAQSDHMREEKLALIDKGRANYLSAVERELCHKLSGLAVKGGDAEAVGLHGREIRAGLRWCLNGVINGRVENSKAALTDYLKVFAEKCRDK